MNKINIILKYLSDIFIELLNTIKYKKYNNDKISEILS